MKKNILILDKPIGKTPLQIIEKLKTIGFEYKFTTISYAGRLDPMAHGVLVLLIGDENKKREDYLHLDKMYQVEILFGFTTDSYDLLGKVSKGTNMPITREKIERVFPRFVGKRKQPYPPFSSQPVNGKPLFYWARNNKLHEITIPTKDITVYSIQFLSMRTLRGEQLQKEIEQRIGCVAGDFRQKEILGTWRQAIDKNVEYPLVSCTIFCSSGTYMRSLAQDIGKYIGCGAVAFDIYRTQVGSLTIADSLILD
jgi:tRNA pseudouridine55 synthase